MLVRLDKFLADSGEGTRSTVKQMIKQGRVHINGLPAERPDVKVDTDIDEIRVDGRSLIYREYEYFMLNKPAGVISASNDKTQKTVLDLIDIPKRRDLFPVGRLDKDTEGLLIITNDGPLCNRLLAPGKHVQKTYFAKVRGNVTEKDVETFRNGVDIGDAEPAKEAELILLGREEDETGVYSLISLTITEGRYHQVKRMFLAVGKEVAYLKRISMGPLKLDDALSSGAWRRLTENEIFLLKQLGKQDSK